VAAGHSGSHFQRRSGDPVIYRALVTAYPRIAVHAHTNGSANATAAIEPPAKLSEVSPADGIALLNSPDGLACVVTDPSASWGLGVDAARLTIDRVRAYSGTTVNNVETLSKFVGDAALQAEAKLAQENADADALFSGAVVTITENWMSWATAGDLMIALCSLQSVVWLNGEWRTDANGLAKLRTKPATWYPGLLGCTRAQRSTNLLTPGWTH
jgi:hypothetical protein